MLTHGNTIDSFAIRKVVAKYSRAVEDEFIEEKSSLENNLDGKMLAWLAGLQPLKLKEKVRAIKMYCPNRLFRCLNLLLITN